MSLTIRRWLRTSAASTAVLAAAMLGSAPSGEARVTRIVVDEVVSPAFDGQVFGAAGAYETVAGRAFGELDPRRVWGPTAACINARRLLGWSRSAPAISSTARAGRC